MLDYISSSIRRKLTFVMLGTAVVALLVYCDCDDHLRGADLSPNLGR